MTGTWFERFPAQPGIELWLHYVTDRPDLRKDILFSTTLTSAEYDAGLSRWTVRTAQGDVDEAEEAFGGFVVAGCQPTAVFQPVE